MKIIVFCSLIALVCAFPTDSQVKTPEEHENVRAIQSAYANREKQQSSTVKTDEHKPKRDTASVVHSDVKKPNTDDHLSQYHDNASPSFVKPVPVEQVLGNVHLQSHSKTNDATKKDQAPVAHETKSNTPKPAVFPAKLSETVTKLEGTQKRDVADNKKQDETVKSVPQSKPVEKNEDKKDGDRLTRETPKAATQTKPVEKSEDKKPEQKPVDRKTRETPKAVAQPEPVIDTNKSQVDDHKHHAQTLPFNVENHPRITRDTPAQVPTQSNNAAPSGSVQPPRTVPYIPKGQQVPAAHHDLKGAEISRLVRDVPKVEHAVNGPTPVPQLARVELTKTDNTKPVQAVKLH